MSVSIPLIGRKLYEKNFISGREGNISERKGGRIVITPSSVRKSDLREKDLCLMDLEGKSLKGNPSSEKLLHLFIYRERKEAAAVIHAHPPWPVALSLARPEWKYLPFALAEIALSLGLVPFVPYRTPGTPEMAEALRPFIKKSRAFILSNHGALVWGESLESAWAGMEELSRGCEIICLSESLGKTALLPKKEIAKLLAKT